ncbi:POTRA domain-containing protein, partial [Oleiphilus sp. HI0128]
MFGVKKIIRSWLALSLLILAIAPLAAKAEAFIINDIRVDGLKRVSAGSVFSAFILSVGETASEEKIVEASKALFKTGLFTDIEIAREDRDLVIIVQERPSISKIEIEGNKDISEEDLLEGL